MTTRTGDRPRRALARTGCAHSLSAQDRETLIAAFDVILPGDDDGVGANGADAITFVEAALANGNCRRNLKRVIEGLPLLDAYCEAMCGVSFTEATPLGRSDVLLRLRDTPHPTVIRFLVALVRVTLAGFLTSPRHGGNYDGRGWEHVGYTPHRRSAGIQSPGADQ